MCYISMQAGEIVTFCDATYSVFQTVTFEKPYVKNIRRSNFVCVFFLSIFVGKAGVNATYDVMQ